MRPAPTAAVRRRRLRRAFSRAERTTGSTGLLPRPLRRPRSLVPLELRTPSGLGRREFVAMGTEISVLAPLERIEPAEKAVRSLFGEWESALSRFRPDSEL